MGRYAILFAVCSLAMAGCSGRITKSTDMVFTESGTAPGASGTALEVGFSGVQTRVLTPSCALAGCHGGAVFPYLVAGSAYANLVNAPSSAGIAQVTPGDPDASYLLTKITGGRTMQGARMPPDAAPLDSARIALIRTWIAAGAARD